MENLERFDSMLLLSIRGALKLINSEKLYLMLFPKTIGVQLVRACLSLFFARNKSIPIMTGPLKGKHLPKAEALSNLSMLFGRYEPQVVSALLSMSGPVKVAYDIGAHIGYMTLALAMHLGSDAKVFAFEPDPRNIALMQQMINQNSLQDVVQVNPAALTSSKGQEQLIKGKCSSMFLLKEAVDGQDLKDCPGMMVNTTTLDAFVFEELNPPPDLLKIDVEGAEVLVIQGGLRTLQVYSPNLIIEIHGPKSAGKLWSVLQGFDYTWWRLNPLGSEIVNTGERLLSYFFKDSWIHHFLLVKKIILKEPKKNAHNMDGGK